MSTAQDLPHPSLNAGDLVRLRGALWRVRRLTAGDDCHAVEVSGAERANRHETRVVLTPFDRPQPVDRAGRVRLVSRRAWMRRLATLGASAAEWDEPLVLAHVDADLHPWQLEPTLTFLRGEAARVLLADEVGMGKTVQAALAVVALREAGLADRVLIVCPAGLRDQWRDELAGRVGLASTIIDTPSLAVRAGALPDGINPWSLPGTFIVSADLVKRPEHLNALEGLAWDVLVVDEAHAMTAGSDRARTAAAVAARAKRLLLLTATPHDGDDARFGFLCGLGAGPGADRLAFFRRSRRDVGLRVDRIERMLRITLSPAERRLHLGLQHYVAAVNARNEATTPARLAMTVLVKRSYSCAAALGLTLSRRLALLSEVDPRVEQQSVLPFDDVAGDEVDDRVIGSPGLASSRHERAWLGRLVEQARQAARHERKLAALVRFIRRAREPVIVFTEYRDTLAQVARWLPDGLRVALVHGGLDSDERARSLTEFVRGHATVLLTTDAAAEGLNLHHRCRLVLHLELPWSPRRLEQRVGRVDRLGQRRRVHALGLVGGETGETELLDRLQARQARADASLGSLSPGSAPTTAPSGLRVDATKLAARLAAIRATRSSSRPRDVSRPDVPVSLARGRRWPLEAGGWLAIVRIEVETATGTCLGRVLAIWIRHRARPCTRRGDLIAAANALLASRRTEILDLATREIDTWVFSTLGRLAPLVAVEREREAALADRLHRGIVREAQPGLFDSPWVTTPRGAPEPGLPSRRGPLAGPWLVRRSPPEIVQLMAVTPR